MSKTALETGRTSKKQLDSDLNSYSATASFAVKGKARGKDMLAFGAATSAALLGGTAVEAAIIHTPVGATLSPAMSSTQSANINMGASGSFNIFARGSTSSVYNTFFGSTATATSPGGASITAGNGGSVAINSARTQARKFSSGDMVGTSGSNLGTWRQVATDTNIGSSFSSTGFIGVKTGADNFGWIQVQASYGPQTVTIIDYAYDDSGAHILAGDTGSSAVPEPRTALLMGLGLLALGATGVQTMRRRRREQEEAAA
jgi:hypothetical protein